MTARRVDDWTLLPGQHAEVRHGARTVCSGTVDAVTPDGAILWVQPRGACRRLFAKAEGYELWSSAGGLGFHYRLAAAGRD